MLAIDHMLLTLAGAWPRGRLLGPNQCRLDPALAGRRCVALTFDDGPDPEVTPQVLDLLDAAGAGATFFAIGRHAEAHPEIIAEIVRRGHRVENHSYHHSNDLALSFPRSLGLEIDQAQAALARTSGRWPVYFRAPAGMHNPFFEPVLARRGLGLVSWSRRGYDAVDCNPRRVFRRLTDGLRAGDILLLHDGVASGRRRRPAVVLEVLPRLLDVLADRRLRSVPIPDPQRATGATGGHRGP